MPRHFRPSMPPDPAATLPAPSECHRPDDAPASAAGRRRPLPQIDPARCTGCGRCVAVCGPRLLSLEVVRWKKTSVLAGAERCTGCSLCASACPFGAITMRRGPAPSGHAA